MYSLAALLILTSIYYFIRLLEKETRPIFISYIFWTACLLYTHYSSILVIILQNLIFAILYFLREKGERKAMDPKKWINSQVILFFIYLPWIGVGVSRFFGIQNAITWLPRPYVRSILMTLVEYSGSVALFMLFAALAVVCREERP